MLLSHTLNCVLGSPGLERTSLVKPGKQQWLRSENATLISVGTSGVVRPAADIPEIALASGATVIHVNIGYVCLGAPNELMLIGSAAQVLPALLQASPST